MPSQIHVLSYAWLGSFSWKGHQNHSLKKLDFEKKQKNKEKKKPIWLRMMSIPPLAWKACPT